MDITALLDRDRRNVCHVVSAFVGLIVFVIWKYIMDWGRRLTIIPAQQAMFEFFLQILLVRSSGNRRIWISPVQRQFLLIDQGRLTGPAIDSNLISGWHRIIATEGLVMFTCGERRWLWDARWRCFWLNKPVSQVLRNPVLRAAWSALPKIDVCLIWVNKILVFVPDEHVGWR